MTGQLRDVQNRYGLAICTYVFGHEYGHFALGHLLSASAAVGADNAVTDRARLNISRLQELEADSVAVSMANTLLGRTLAAQGLFLNTTLLLATEKVVGPSDPYTSDHPYWKDRLHVMLDTLYP